MSAFSGRWHDGRPRRSSAPRTPLRKRGDWVVVRLDAPRAAVIPRAQRAPGQAIIVGEETVDAVGSPGFRLADGQGLFTASPSATGLEGRGDAEGVSGEVCRCRRVRRPASSLRSTRPRGAMRSARPGVGISGRACRVPDRPRIIARTSQPAFPPPARRRARPAEGVCADPPQEATTVTGR